MIWTRQFLTVSTHCAMSGKESRNAMRLFFSRALKKVEKSLRLFLDAIHEPKTELQKGWDRKGEPKAKKALWSGTNKNGDVSTEPLARPFARSLTPLTRSLARSLTPLVHLLRTTSFARALGYAHSFARSLCSLPCSWESEFLMSQNDLVLSDSALLSHGFTIKITNLMKDLTCCFYLFSTSSLIKLENLDFLRRIF